MNWITKIQIRENQKYPVSDRLSVFLQDYHPWFSVTLYSPNQAVWECSNETRLVQTFKIYFSKIFSIHRVYKKVNKINEQILSTWAIVNQYLFLHFFSYFFTQILETWLSFVQPWRYQTNNQHSDTSMDNFDGDIIAWYEY